jgi:hypothetical protein
VAWHRAYDPAFVNWVFPRFRLETCLEIGGMNLFGLLIVAAGLFSVAGATFDWEFL